MRYKTKPRRMRGAKALSQEHRPSASPARQALILKARSYRMKRKPTLPETVLFRALEMTGKAWVSRQYVIGHYILDFYWRKGRIAIEVDGPDHRTPKGLLYDKARDAWLGTKGIRVIRVTNLDVLADPLEVAKRIGAEFQAVWEASRSESNRGPTERPAPAMTPSRENAPPVS